MRYPTRIYNMFHIKFGKLKDELDDEDVEWLIKRFPKADTLAKTLKLLVNEVKEQDENSDRIQFQSRRRVSE